MRNISTVVRLILYCCIFPVATLNAQEKHQESECITPIYKADEVDVKAKITEMPEIEISEEARKNQVSGTIILIAVFCRTGEITDIQAVKNLPYGLTERAVEAARKIKFIPAEKGGEKVSQRTRIEYNINIH